MIADQIKLLLSKSGVAEFIGKKGNLILQPSRGSVLGGE